MTKEEVTQYLQGLPDEQLVDLLRKVFAVKNPYPEEEASRSHFYLGMAISDLQDGPFGIGHRWGPWETGAVAYTDHKHYGDEWDLGPDWGLCQSGTCGNCGTKVYSNNKHGICPICGTEVYMT